MNEKTMPILDHFSELRHHLIRALLGLFLGMTVSLLFGEEIMSWLKKPLLISLPSGSSLVILAPQEYFITKLKASFFIGLIISSPWIFYQLWCFLSPGLYENEKKILYYSLIGSGCFFLLGVLFAYYLVLPPAFQFFIDTLPTNVTGSYSIAMLYGFALTILLGFAAVFQTPLVVFLLVIFNVISISDLISYRRYVLVFCFIVGAILTPPDPLTQIMLALPMYALYEFSICLTSLFVKNIAKSY